MGNKVLYINNSGKYIKINFNMKIRYIYIYIFFFTNWHSPLKRGRSGFLEIVFVGQCEVLVCL